MQNIKRMHWFSFLLILLVPITGVALGVTASIQLGIDQTGYSNLVINLFFLAGCLSLIPILKFSPEHLGMKIIKGNVRWHMLASISIITLYMLYYILVIRISSLRPFSSNTAWGLPELLPEHSPVGYGAVYDTHRA
jgi:hypothetical protein